MASDEQPSTSAIGDEVRKVNVRDDGKLVSQLRGNGDSRRCPNWVTAGCHAPVVVRDPERYAVAVYFGAHLTEPRIGVGEFGRGPRHDPDTGLIALAAAFWVGRCPCPRHKHTFVPVSR